VRASSGSPREHLGDPYPVALTIAGSDPTGGAGIQADLRTLALFGVHGAAVVTALTIQDTEAVHEVIKVPHEVLRKQLMTLCEDVTVQAVKTGILVDDGQIKIIEEVLHRYPIRQYVLDPILRASSGYPFLRREEMAELTRRLFPLAMVVTPNVQEVEYLTGLHVGSEADLRKAAKALHGFGSQCVLITGGHLETQALDLLYDGRDYHSFPGEKIAGKRLHGAGCAFSAALTACLARGIPIVEAVGRVKRWIHASIQRAQAVGRGRDLLGLVTPD